MKGWNKWKEEEEEEERVGRNLNGAVCADGAGMTMASDSSM